MSPFPTLPVPPYSRPVSRIVLGSVPLSKARLDESLELIAEYVRLGGNAIDTAHIYGPERHEIVGEFLRAHGRDSLILMDKCCHPMSGRKRVTRQDLISDLCENQSRMGIERTDFFVLHRDDPEVPAGQVIDWMNEQLGRIAAFGASNWSFERIREGNEYAAKRGLQGFSMSSVNLALAFPQDEMWKGAVAADREARTWHEQSGLPLFSWSAGAAGFFAGVDSDDVRRVYRNESNLARKARVEELAPKLGASPAQLALAWVLNQPMNSFAIIGPRSVEELREGMAAAEIKLAPEQLEWLEKGE